MADIFQNAINAYIQGQTKEAEKLCKKILKSYPNAHQVLHLLALIEKRYGKYKNAIKTLNKAIKLAPSIHTYWNNLGETYREMGNLSKAIECYKKAINIQPEYAEANCNWGIALLSMENYKEAEQYLIRATQINPDLANAHYNLGVLHNRVGSIQQAKKSFENSLKIDPNSIETLVNLASINIDEYQLSQAKAKLSHVISIDPNNILANINFGRLHYNRGHTAEAIKYYSKATIIEQNNYEAWLGLARSYKKSCRFLDAVNSFKKAIAIKADSTEAMAGLADASWKYYGKDDAINKLNSYLKAYYEDSQLHLQLASILLDDSNFTEAEAEARLCLSFQPDNVYAYDVLSQIDVSKDKEHDIERMLELFKQSGQDNYKKTVLAFAIARILDSTGDYDAAFKYYEQGNKLLIETHGDIEFNLDKFSNTASKIIASFNISFFKSNINTGFEDGTPIFIVGLPRCGKTLTETILCKTTNATPAGESVQFLESLNNIFTKENIELFPAGIATLKPHHYKLIGEEYVSVQKEQFMTTQHIINTLPGNVPFLGMIPLCLPQAKIIWVDRDLKDTCFEIYRKHFARENEFSYDLKTCGEYAKTFNGLMEHWTDVIPEYIYRIKFEDLITDSKAQLKLIANFGNLELQSPAYDLSTLIPSENRVTGLWKPYAKQLSPLINTLERR